MSSPPATSPPPYQRASFDVARHSAKHEAAALQREELDPPAPPQLRRAVTRLRLVVGALAFVAVGVVAYLGGFEQVPDRGTPQVAVAEQVDAGAWRVAIDAAVAGAALHRVTPAGGGYLVEVDATIEVLDDRTRAINDVIKLDGMHGAAEKPARILSLRDERAAFYLQPGLPEKVAFIWEIAKGAPVPNKLSVVIIGAHERLTYFRFLDSTIEDTGPQAIVAVAVTDRTVAT